MINEKDTIRCEAIFNDEHTHRYLWRRTWSKDKPLATVIMLNPCMADTLTMDTTTFLVVNNIAKLEEYGGVIIVNLFSMMSNKISFRWNSDEDLNGPENDNYIRKAATESEVVILAWGRTQDTNQRIADRAIAVLSLLQDCKEKLRVLSDGLRDGIHPLTPSVRSQWVLKPFDATAAIGPAARRQGSHGPKQGEKTAAQTEATAESAEQPTTSREKTKEAVGEASRN